MTDTLPRSAHLRRGLASGRRIALAALRREKPQRRPQPSIGQRDAGGCRGARRRCDARNDRERNVCGSQRIHLFARAAENCAVSALEADDDLACCGVLAEAPVDLFLRDLTLVVALADTLHAGGWRNQLENFRREQVVV